MAIIKSNKTKLSTEQVAALGHILALIQELYSETNSEVLAKKFGTSKQLLQYHANKEKGGSK